MFLLIISPHHPCGFLTIHTPRSSTKHSKADFVRRIGLTRAERNCTEDWRQCLWTLLGYWGLLSGGSESGGRGVRGLESVEGRRACLGCSGAKGGKYV